MMWPVDDPPHVSRVSGDGPSMPNRPNMLAAEPPEDDPRFPPDTPDNVKRMLANYWDGYNTAQADYRAFAAHESDGTKPDTGYLGTGLNWADGSGTIALPNWLPSPFVEINGPHGVLENGGCRVTTPGWVAMTMHGYVRHQWDRWIIFGFRWNGGPIYEMARVQIKSNDPVLIFYEKNIELLEGGLLETFISSDFEWASFGWAQGSMMFLVEGSSYESVVGTPPPAVGGKTD